MTPSQNATEASRLAAKMPYRTTFLWTHLYRMSMRILSTVLKPPQIRMGGIGSRCLPVQLYRCMSLCWFGSTLVGDHGEDTTAFNSGRRGVQSAGGGSKGLSERKPETQNMVYQRPRDQVDVCVKPSWLMSFFKPLRRRRRLRSFFGGPSMPGGHGRSAHANAHDSFTRGGGSDLRNQEEGSLQGREGTQAGTTKRHCH